MSHNKNKVLRRRLAGSYLSSLLSITLVPPRMRPVPTLVLATGSIEGYLKENVRMTLVLKQGTPAREAVALQRSLEDKEYVKSTSYVSVQQGTEEMARLLGEDFLESFEESPVPSSIEVAIKAEWMSRDKLEQIARELSRDPMVEEVSCPVNMLDSLGDAIRRWAFVLLAVMLLMLFISVVLISSTVRLSIYSNRFSIRTMDLVGAPESFIARPYVGRAAGQGLLAALIASGLLFLILKLVEKGFPQIFEIFGLELVGLCAGILAVCGALLCVVCARSVTRRLVRMDQNELYG